MTVRRQNQMVKDVTQVSAASKLGDYEIIDARSPGRFAEKSLNHAQDCAQVIFPDQKTYVLRTC